MGQILGIVQGAGLNGFQTYSFISEIEKFFFGYGGGNLLQ